MPQPVDFYSRKKRALFIEFSQIELPSGFSPRRLKPATTTGFKLLGEHCFSVLLQFLFLLFLSIAGSVYAEFPPTYIYKLAPGEVFFKFDFEDLAGRRWASQDLLGKPIVILTGHRYLRYDIREWALALKSGFAEKGEITLLWVANPSRLRWETVHENVIAEWKDFDAPVPLILDWHSQIGRSLKIFYNTPNIIGVDSAGKLVFHDSLVCTKDNLLLISEKIRRMH